MKLGIFSRFDQLRDGCPSQDADVIQGFDDGLLDGWVGVIKSLIQSSDADPDFGSGAGQGFGRFAPHLHVRVFQQAAKRLDHGAGVRAGSAQRGGREGAGARLGRFERLEKVRDVFAAQSAFHG